MSHRRKIQYRTEVNFGYIETRHLDYPTESKPVTLKKIQKMMRWSNAIIREKRALKGYEKDSLIRKEIVFKSQALATSTSKIK